MKIDVESFRIADGDKVKLKKRPTSTETPFGSKIDYERRLGEHAKRLSRQQELLYASNSHALLVIFQAMDAAGKDGAIKHVMSGVNPQGCQVYSFKHPSAEELKHDFLWRTTRDLPERGRIGIFNRSYYEEVLIARVHPEILVGEGLPRAEIDGEAVWDERFRSIRGFEQHLHANGTRIAKIFLHISAEEQKRRLLARIDDEEKRWKFDAGDLREREFWKEYMCAYEDCIAATSSKHSPWYIVPADDKKTARLAVSEIILSTLESLDMAFPELSKSRLAELAEFRARLARAPS